MNLILTHEQVDFDALGALIAARLLFGSTIAVLPHKLNQNVRKFVNLYINELHLVEMNDLPGEPVESVTLVDTQSLVTLKNFRKDAAVLVIDHHTEKPDLPGTWKRIFEKVGATTTILTHQLKERSIHISPLEATVMLLGIHEDTGSLTYASTTLKDIYAAAWLVENGADLKLLNDYLNPPLSLEQMNLADELLRNAQIINVKGKKVFISHATDMALDEEVSSIAHKIRDLIDPDALFLLVRSREGLRMVARSTTDDIDVSLVAHLFGGGGHSRAAAALVHSDDELLKKDNWIDIVNSRIIDFLQNTIKPSLTVSKIMSKKPVLITKKTTVSEALSMMKRYGYEGYPVVDGSTVEGLLTRRAVDKAAGHKLEVSAGSIMDAGNYFLTPGQTLDEVQELMANTGWGQIPVIDPDKKAIVGIVTRTDLLKNLHKLSPKKFSNENYGSRLEKALSPGLFLLLTRVIETANTHNFPIYLVGGFVRDLLLERPSRDLDIVIEGDAISVAGELAKKFGGRVVTHRRFGTAKWQIKDVRDNIAVKLKMASDAASELPECLDLISSRTEFYERPTAMPTVENSSIKLDLQRRDFTINTLALRLDRAHYGELIDHFGGLHDLHNKKIRVLHSLSFVDDPTRLLRAVRFEQRFDFQIEERTLQLMEEARPMLHEVSGDRLRHEFDLTFRESLPGKVLARMARLELLTPIHKALAWDPGMEEPINSLCKHTPEPKWNLPANVGNLPTWQALYWLVWLGKLPVDAVQQISQRFKFPAPLSSALKSTAEIYPALHTLALQKPSEITAQFDAIQSPSLYAAYLLSSKQSVRKVILEYVQKWRTIQPKTSGDDLRNQGILPGPEYKRVLNTLRAAYLDGTITTVEEEKQLLNYLVQQD
jgi:tRNA nucleotidyltransferase (CCA-adding enzyme)